MKRLACCIAATGVSSQGLVEVRVTTAGPATSAPTAAVQGLPLGL